MVAQTIWLDALPFIHWPIQIMKIASGDGQPGIPMICDKQQQAFGIEGQHTIHGPIDFGE